MELLDKYLNYRETLVGLHSNILDECVSANDFNKSVETLGVVKNNEVVLESKSESDFILDFNIYENINNDENAVFEYVKKGIETTEQEKIILAAMKTQYHSLFEIIDIQKEKCLITIKDLLNNQDVVKVVDIGLSESANKNILVYARLLDLSEFSITSGIGFTFSINHKDYLIKRSRKLMKKIKRGDSSIRRLIAFFMLNRTDGLPIMFVKANR